MIFLITRCWYRVNACWMCKNFVLWYKRRRCILRDHEPDSVPPFEVEMLASHLKCRIHKSLCTTLRNISQLRNCNSQYPNYCQRLPMKVSAWQNFIFKNERIIFAEFISIQILLVHDVPLVLWLHALVACNVANKRLGPLGNHDGFRLFRCLPKVCAN